MSEKNKLAEKLLYAPKNGYDRLSAEDEKAMEAYCEDYKKFLNNGKTERLCVEYCIELAEKKGFKAYEAGMKLSAGDKVYFNNRSKGIMLAVIGSEDLSHGVISAELEVVPAGKARDIGFDRSFIASYGHDDRVCAYAELAGIFDAVSPKKTAVCIFADKEEIGSEGVSGMLSQAFEWFMGDMCRTQGVALSDCFANSFCLSADVTAAYDPNFADVYDKRNSAFVNYGVALCKYTGSGGKGGASDASAEVVGKVRKLMNDNGVFWQMAEMGKTDAGGGGTVAKFMAQRNIDTLDAGVPVLSMHAPYETVAKLDCYMTYKCMKAIFEQA